MLGIIFDIVVKTLQKKSILSFEKICRALKIMLEIYYISHYLIFIQINIYGPPTNNHFL